MEFYPAASAKLQSALIDWLAHELDHAADVRNQDAEVFLTRQQRTGVSPVHGRMTALIPGFGNHKDIPKDYGLIAQGSTSQIPSFVVHPVPENLLDAARRFYTTQWEKPARGSVQQVVLISWARLAGGHLEGSFEVFTYDGRAGVEALVQSQCGKFLPETSETIEIYQKSFLGGAVPCPEAKHSLSLATLAENVTNALQDDELLAAHAASESCCVPAPLNISTALSPKPDTARLDILLRTPSALAPPIALPTPPSSPITSKFPPPFFPSPAAAFAPTTLHSLAAPLTAAEFLTLYANITATLSLPIPTALAALATSSSTALAPACVSLGLTPAAATTSLATLALYDPIILCDDSGSMRQQGRYRILSDTVQRLAPIATRLSGVGTKLRFINYAQDRGFNDLRTPEQLKATLAAVRPKGWTPIGTMLRTKVTEPHILAPARRGTLQRPVLVVIITDGEPTEEHRSTLKREVLRTKRELAALGAGERAAVFQINYVGDGPESREYIMELERDEEVAGKIGVNCDKIDDAFKRMGDKCGDKNAWLLRLLSGAVWQGCEGAGEGGIGALC
ncbi:hypothetical protein EDC01DRAFT_429973 [Geopyxis carbonaria]|nr:hypothetical protein EDC01DRAFT_429973 [Geopyxis carbonaria]